MKVAELIRVFQIQPGAVIALVGGGGKTSLMFALAKAAAPRYSAITTTTTKIKMPSLEESAVTWIDPSEAILEARWQTRGEQIRHATLAVGVQAEEEKLAGVRPECIDRWARERLADLIIVEADGAKGRSLKAPNETEPVIPTATTELIAVIGIDAVGQPFGEATVFRSERARQLIGAPPGNRITPEWAAALVTHPGGICKDAPSHARMIFFINKVESPEAARQAERLAEQIRCLSTRSIAAIIAGSLHKAGGEAGSVFYEFYRRGRGER